ncbi:hypothetical protein JS531_10440 [Bifidobacterium sp. CP2]|uniref:hypothetical protein n=1 Tax=Bifidobacterium sp. CP2 TaxID=2809025 RepID=UPI001BDC5A46|nr:hypothetical protein [Bifidobacterium sp. CP2]MBT1182353.1 hypothetical protein [Bifidobacterium sp. CP2]
MAGAATSVDVGVYAGAAMMPASPVCSAVLGKVLTPWDAGGVSGEAGSGGGSAGLAGVFAGAGLVEVMLRAMDLPGEGCREWFMLRLQLMAGHDGKLYGQCGRSPPCYPQRGVSSTENVDNRGWWLVAGGWWLVAGGWWLVAGGWWLVAGGWWSRRPHGRHPVIRRCTVVP